MQYNYSYEIAAIIFMSVILLDFLLKKRFYRTSTRVFFVFLCASILDSVFNTLSSLLIAYADQVPLWMNIAAAEIFFILQSIDLYLFFLYVYLLCRNKRGIHKMELVLLSVPFLLNTIFTVMTPFNGFYFYFNEQRQYCQGSGSAISYYYIYIYIIISFIYAVIHWKRLRRQDRLIILSYCAAFVLAMAIQFNYKSLLLTGIARAFTVLLVYVSMENPNDYTDKLTGIMNTYAFQVMVKNYLFKKKKFQVIYIDIDKFRYLNMAHGYANGDRVLQEVAQFLERHSSGRGTYRMGSDTFAVILDGQQKDAERFVDFLHRRFEHPWKVADTETKLSISVVMLEYPKHFQDTSSLNDLMKYLMRSLKKNHEDFYLHATDETIQACNRRKAVEIALRKALFEQRLEVYYQPIHGRAKREVVSLEALSRLFDDRLCMIPPDEFIEVAIDTGLINQLGDYVFEKVCVFLHEHLLSMKENTVKKVQINLSMVQCMQPDLPDKYIGIMKKYDIPPQMIDLEITERAALHSPDILLNNMRKLIDYGVSFSLDDYGTGNSNISYLIRFPFAQIKFDKTMVWSYFEKEEARIVIENEFHILQKLHKNIVVEGIETKEQYEEMCRKNIPYFQGFLFSKALPEEACLEYIRTCSEYDRGVTQEDGNNS